MIEGIKNSKKSGINQMPGSHYTIVKSADRLASSSRRLASISLVGGYFGRLEGSQAYGSVLKNCRTSQINIFFNKQNLLPETQKLSLQYLDQTTR